MLIPLPDLSPADLAAWRDLAGRSREPNPFAEPEFVIPAAGAFGPAELLVTDGWTAALPVRRARSWRRLPVPCVAGWSHPYCFLGTPLLAGSRAALQGQANLLVLEQTAVDVPGAVVWQRWHRAALYRREENTYLAETVRGTHLKNLRRLRRKLDADLRDRAGEPDAVEQFLRLETSGWKGRSGTAMAPSGHGDFFREVCASFAAAGRLRLLSLERDGTPVAMNCILVAGEVGFTFKVAYDESLARFSPGQLLDVDLVAWFHHDSGLAALDSCAEPGNEAINRLWPDRRSLATVLLPGPGLAGWMARQVVTGAAVVRRTVRGDA